MTKRINYKVSVHSQSKRGQQISILFILSFLTGYVVIPLTEENLRAVAMENDSSAEIEVDAYLSGSVVKALTQKSEVHEDLLSNTIDTNVEIQAGSEDFKVQCQNIGKGADGIFRMCVLDNGEVINSLKNHIDSYAMPEIINSGFEGVYEDNSETILNIASESIQSTQFLENAVSQDAFTIQQTAVSNFENNTDTLDPVDILDISDMSRKSTTPVVDVDVLKDLGFHNLSNKDCTESVANVCVDTTPGISQTDMNEFFMPDFETLLWNENNMLEPTFVESDKSGENRPEYIDIGDFAFISKTIEQDPLADVANKNQENCCNDLSELQEVLQTCSNKNIENENTNSKKTCNKNCSKNDSDKSSCCVTVCLNTLKQLRKVLEQRCCVAGKTSLI